MTTEQKIQYIADHYGYETQSRQLIEEMAELTVAINKMWRRQWRRNEYNTTSKELAEAHYNILEEIADTLIMILQIKYLIGVREGELSEIIEQKLDRQIERIKNEQRVDN